MLNVVIDTNVFVSSLLRREGPSRKVINAWLDGKFQLVCSKDLLGELEATLQKRKLATRIPLFEIILLFSLIQDRARIINPIHKTNVCRDWKDNMVLACAVESNSFLITGDEDLLLLSPFRASSEKTIKIFTPADFLERLKEE